MFHAGITDTFIEPERFYPGAHVFFVGSCRDVCVFEDAGFELRDCVFDLGGGLLWWLLRRPVVGTVAANVLTYGVGAINIDGSRIGFVSEADRKESTAKNQHADFGTAPMTGNTTYGDYSMVQPKNYNPPGRWPANIILDLYTAQLLDKQSGISKSTGGKNTPNPNGSMFGVGGGVGQNAGGLGDVGGASRFFYVAQQPQDLIQYLTNLILPPNGKLFFQLKEQETHDR